jgi:hypothetical protein
MQSTGYKVLSDFRDEFRAYVESLSERSPWLGGLQEKLRLESGYQDYAIETPVVYNTALDELDINANPKFIIVADNPGKNEQKAAQRRYLVGQSGKLARGWFGRELGLDFETSAIIVNKTPIHTPKTAELARLRGLAREASPEIGREFENLFEESQRKMARMAFELHSGLGCVLWISGYGELKRKGLFAAWMDEMEKLYTPSPRSLKSKVWVFRHFSMNQFSIEYSSSSLGMDAIPVMSRLREIGTANRLRLLGW